MDSLPAQQIGQRCPLGAGNGLQNNCNNSETGWFFARKVKVVMGILPKMLCQFERGARQNLSGLFDFIITAVKRTTGLLFCKQNQEIPQLERRAHEVNLNVPAEQVAEITPPVTMNFEEVEDVPCSMRKAITNVPAPSFSGVVVEDIEETVGQLFQPVIETVDVMTVADGLEFATQHLEETYVAESVVEDVSEIAVEMDSSQHGNTDVEKMSGCIDGQTNKMKDPEEESASEKISPLLQTQKSSKVEPTSENNDFSMIESELASIVECAEAEFSQEKVLKKRDEFNECIRRHSKWLKLEATENKIKMQSLFLKLLARYVFLGSIDK